MVRIKDGGAAEIEDLMRLIKDLAEFERAPEAVITTEAELRSDWKDQRF